MLYKSQKGELVLASQTLQGKVASRLSVAPRVSLFGKVFLYCHRFHIKHREAEVVEPLGALDLEASCQPADYYQVGLEST